MSLSLFLFIFISSRESKFNFLIKIKEDNGKKINTKIDIEIHILCQLVTVNRYTVKTGKINSAVERPNQPALNAFPLDLVKYLVIVVDAVCDINPCPENLIKKTAINKKVMDDTFEKKKQEKACTNPHKKQKNKRNKKQKAPTLVKKQKKQKKQNIGKRPPGHQPWGGPPP